MKPNHLLSGHWDGLQAATLRHLSPLLHATVQEELIFISSTFLRIPMALGKEPLSSVVYREGLLWPWGFNWALWPLGFGGQGESLGKGGW